MTDPDALIYAMPKPRKRRGRPKRQTRLERFRKELNRVDLGEMEPEDNVYLMTEMARIALGPIDLGPMMPVIGRRVKQICDIAIDKALE